MARFIERWEKAKQKAEAGSEKDKKRYKERLKAIGLSPDGRRSKVDLEGDKKEGFLEDSAVLEVPRELAPGFKALQRDLNRSDNN